MTPDVHGRDTPVRHAQWRARLCLTGVATRPYHRRFEFQLVYSSELPDSRPTCTTHPEGTPVHSLDYTTLHTNGGGGAAIVACTTAWRAKSYFSRGPKWNQLLDVVARRHVCRGHVRLASCCSARGPSMRQEGTLVVVFRETPRALNAMFRTAHFGIAIRQESRSPTFSSICCSRVTLLLVVLAQVTSRAAISPRTTGVAPAAGLTMAVKQEENTRNFWEGEWVCAGDAPA